MSAQWRRVSRDDPIEWWIQVTGACNTNDVSMSMRFGRLARDAGPEPEAKGGKNDEEVEHGG